MSEPFRMRDEAHNLDPVANRRGSVIGDSSYIPDFDAEKDRELTRVRVENFNLKQKNRTLTIERDTLKVRLGGFTRGYDKLARSYG